MKKYQTNVAIIFSFFIFLVLFSSLYLSVVVLVFSKSHGWNGLFRRSTRTNHGGLFSKSVCNLASPFVWCFKSKNLFDYDSVRKAWQDFIREEENGWKLKVNNVDMYTSAEKDCDSKYSALSTTSQRQHPWKSWNC